VQEQNCENLAKSSGFYRAISNFEFTRMTTSPQGIKLIQHYESCRLKAYQDSKGISTVGWGNTTYLDGRPVKMGDTITQQQADDLFAKSLLKYEQMVLTRIKRELLQQEFDAAVSFCYNAGTSYKTSGGTWKDYDLWKHINNRYFDIANYWQSCAVTAGGKKLKGLVNRRKSEVHLYLTGEVKFYN
jgi:lysozyme